VPFSWSDTKRLLRLQGVAEELLALAPTSQGHELREALDRQLGILTQEVHVLLAEANSAMADEFQRVVAMESGAVPPEIRAAALAGWLKASIAAESLEAKAEQEVANREPRRRKHTIGFKIRPAVGREAGSVPEAAPVDETAPPA
jgi:hypothetical protein